MSRIKGRADQTTTDGLATDGSAAGRAAAGRFAAGGSGANGAPTEGAVAASNSVGGRKTPAEGTVLSPRTRGAAVSHPERQSENQIKQAVIHMADFPALLDGLSARYRFLLSEIIYHGKTDDEMARRLGVARQAVQTELADALTHLYMKVVESEHFVPDGPQQARLG